MTSVTTKVKTFLLHTLAPLILKYLYQNSQELSLWWIVQRWFCPKLLLLDAAIWIMGRVASRLHAVQGQGRVLFPKSPQHESRQDDDDDDDCRDDQAAPSMFERCLPSASIERREEAAEAGPMSAFLKQMGSTATTSRRANAVRRPKRSGSRRRPSASASALEGPPADTRRARSSATRRELPINNDRSATATSSLLAMTEAPSFFNILAATASKGRHQQPTKATKQQGRPQQVKQKKRQRESAGVAGKENRSWQQEPGQKLSLVRQPLKNSNHNRGEVDAGMLGQLQQLTIKEEGGATGLMGLFVENNTTQPTKTKALSIQPTATQKIPKTTVGRRSPKRTAKSAPETQLFTSSMLVPLDPPTKTTASHSDSTFRKQESEQSRQEQIELVKAKSGWLDLERKSLQLPTGSSAASMKGSHETSILAAKPTKTIDTAIDTVTSFEKKRPATEPEVPFWALTSKTMATKNQVPSSPSSTSSSSSTPPIMQSDEWRDEVASSPIMELSSPETNATNLKCAKITEEKQPNQQQVTQSTTPVERPALLMDDGLMDGGVQSIHQDLDDNDNHVESGDFAENDDNMKDTIEAENAQDEKELTNGVPGDLQGGSSFPDNNNHPNGLDVAPNQDPISKNELPVETAMEEKAKAEAVESLAPVEDRSNVQSSRQTSNMLPQVLDESLMLWMLASDPVVASSNTNGSDLTRKRSSRRTRQCKSQQTPEEVIELSSSSEDESPIDTISNNENGYKDITIDSESESDSKFEASVDGKAAVRRLTRQSSKKMQKTKRLSDRSQSSKITATRRRSLRVKPEEKQQRDKNKTKKETITLANDVDSSTVSDKQLAKITRRRSGRQRAKPDRFVDLFEEFAPIKTVETPRLSQEKKSPLGKRKARQSGLTNARTGGETKPCSPNVNQQIQKVSRSLDDHDDESELEEKSPSSSDDEEVSGDENWIYEMSPILLASPSLSTKSVAKSRSSIHIDSPENQSKKRKVCYEVEEVDNRPLQIQPRPRAPIFAHIEGKSFGPRAELRAITCQRLEHNSLLGFYKYADLEKPTGNTYLRMLLRQPPIITAVEEQEQKDKPRGKPPNHKTAKIGFRKPSQLVVEENEDKHSPDDSDESVWSTQEIGALKAAYCKVHALSRTFWDDVAAQIEGRTATGCRQKWFSLVKTPPRKKYGKKKSSLRVAEPFDEDVDDDEDDIFNSTPTGEMAMATKGIKGIEGLAGLDLGAGSPIRFNKAALDNPLDEAEEEELGVGDIREKPGYLSYIRACQKKIRMAKKQGHQKGRTKKVQKAVSKVSEQYGDGDVAVNGNLSPGGTLRVQAQYEEDDEDIVFRDDDAESEDEELF